LKVKKYKFEGVYKVDGKFATVNLVPGYKSANEELISIEGKEYRIWDWWTSKPSAAFKNGLKVFPLRQGDTILYLGLAEAKTASFFSDIVGHSGLIYGVEISERALREAVPVCEKRKNIVPILADARKEESYESVVLGQVEGLYVDVASPDQVAITIRNAEKFLKPNGWCIMAIKSQSIDVVLPPKQVYEKCLKELEKHFEILDKVELDPYEKFHLFVVMQYKAIASGGAGER
jgi:fibrillarin-like pre-rRNA processing protein